MDFFIDIILPIIWILAIVQVIFTYSSGWVWAKTWHGSFRDMSIGRKVYREEDASLYWFALSGYVAIIILSPFIVLGQ